MTKETKKIDFEKVYKDAETKRAELEVKLKHKVKMAVLVAGQEVEPCVVFFRVGTTHTKMQCMDLMYQSPTKAAATFFEATVIRDESDKRVFEQDNDNDVFYFGAIEWCHKQVTQASVYVKKK